MWIELHVWLEQAFKWPAPAAGNRYNHVAYVLWGRGVCVCKRVCEGEEKSRLSEVIHYRRAVISPNANRTYWSDFQFIFFINLLLFPGLNQRVELTFNRVWSGAWKEFHTCLSVGGGNHHWVERAPRLPLRHRMWKNLEVIEIDDRKSTFCPMDMKEKGEFFFIWQKKKEFTLIICLMVCILVTYWHFISHYKEHFNALFCKCFPSITS